MRAPPPLLLLPLLLLPLLLLGAAPAAAQVREFSCVGAERLLEDAVVIPFGQGRDAAAAAGLALLEPIVEEARAAPARHLCVLGFAAPSEGGAQTASRLAARRARAVATELSRRGVERDRVRAEARTRGFLDPGGRGPAGVQRASGVRVVLLPAPP